MAPHARVGSAPSRRVSIEKSWRADRRCHLELICPCPRTSSKMLATSCCTLRAEPAIDCGPGRLKTNQALASTWESLHEEIQCYFDGGARTSANFMPQGLLGPSRSSCRVGPGHEECDVPAFEPRNPRESYCGALTLVVVAPRQQDVSRIKPSREERYRWVELPPPLPGCTLYRR